jgi:hypothetical protein
MFYCSSCLELMAHIVLGDGALRSTVMDLSIVHR